MCRNLVVNPGCFPSYVPLPVTPCVISSFPGLTSPVREQVQIQVPFRRRLIDVQNSVWSISKIAVRICVLIWFLQGTDFSNQGGGAQQRNKDDGKFGTVSKGFSKRYVLYGPNFVTRGQTHISPSGCCKGSRGISILENFPKRLAVCSFKRVEERSCWSLCRFGGHAMRMNFTLFCRFTKQAGDAFLFGTAVATNVSQADKLIIFVSSDIWTI